MNKAQLGAAVRAQIAKGVDPVDAVLDTIGQELLLGNSVPVTGFGTFKVVHRPQRTTRNPQTGEPITVPAKDLAKWTPGARLTSLLNGAPAPANTPIATKAGRRGTR